MYLSGPRAAEVASLPLDGVERVVVSDAVGAASAVKMCTASVYKGRVAILAQALRTAHAHGVLEHVLDDLDATGLVDPEHTGATLGKASAKAWRYVAEMEEIAATQAGVGLTPDLFRALAAVYAELSDQAISMAPEDVPDDMPLEEVLRQLSEEPQAQPAGHPGHEPGERGRAATLVVGSVGADQRGSNHRAARPPKRLRRHQPAIGVDEREAGQLVAPVEGEPREDLAAEVRRPDAVPGEAVAVVDAAAAAEDRQVRGGDVDRTAPGVRDPPAAQLREEAQQVPRAVRAASRSTSRHDSRRPPKPMRPPPQPNAIRPSRVVRR